jgi:DNA-binding SARP family transcriptional activator
VPGAEIRVLGTFEVVVDGRVVDVGGPRLLTVLAVLVAAGGRTVSLSALVEQLWGERQPPDAGRTARTYVSRLRKALGPPGERIETRAPGYVLRLDPDTVDAARFERFAGEGRQALRDEQPALAAERLAAALALWHGEAYGEFEDTPVLRAEATRLGRLRLAATEDRIEADLATGQGAALVAELETLIERHPGHERLWGQLMTALYRAGRQADALQAFRRARTALDETSGVLPSPALVELHRQLLAQDDDHLLPDVPVAPAGPAQLPAAVRPFVGRAGPLAELDAAGGASAGSMVIAGSAGIGKTALAVQWAHRAADRFRDGQLYVDLRGYAGAPPVPPLAALAGFLQALGVAPGQVPLDVEQAAGLYRTLLAGKRMLVLLDNARSADQVRPLLPGGSGCLVLVTSRDRLDGLVARNGARYLALDVLTPAESVGVLSQVAGRHRVDAEPAAAAELARLCAQLPLALRIAAAHLAVRPRRTLAEQVAELAGADRLGTLRVPGDEQTAVRAAFDLSYAAQPAGDRRMFRLLGLSTGPDATVAAAAALAGITAGEAAGALDRLTAANLLAQPAPGRYSCHDLLRQYAAERAEAEEDAAERAAGRRRLTDWCLRTVDAAAGQLYPQMVRLPPPATQESGPSVFADHPTAVAWLDAELANLTAAAESAAATGDRPAAVRLADALRGYFWFRVRPVQWLALAALGRTAARADGDLRGEAAAELSTADAHLVMARYPPAVEHYTRAADLAGRAGWLPAQASALGNLGMVFREWGQLPQAAEHFHRALAIDRRIGAVGAQASRLGNLANVTLELGRLEPAIGQLTEALGLFRASGSSAGEAVVLTNLALVHVERGEPERAEDVATRGLELHRQVGNRNQETDALCVLAQAQRDAGRPLQALEVAEAALALARENGDLRFEPDGRNALASIQHRLGRHDAAIEEYGRALELARQTSAGYVEVTALIGLTRARHSLGLLRDARRDAESALSLATRHGYRSLEAQARTALATVHLALGRTDAAREEALLALRLHRATGHRPGERRTRLLLAGLPDDCRVEVAAP